MLVVMLGMWVLTCGREPLVLKVFLMRSRIGLVMVLLMMVLLALMLMLLLMMMLWLLRLLVWRHWRLRVPPIPLRLLLLQRIRIPPLRQCLIVMPTTNVVINALHTIPTISTSCSASAVFTTTDTPLWLM